MKQIATHNHLYIGLEGNDQILIIAKSGGGKTLAGEGIVEEFHKAGYLVLVIADPKDEFEYCYQMFEPKEKYHLEHLTRIGKTPSKKKVKIYHPFTFNIPNDYLPEMTLFTFSLKDLGSKEWGIIAETDWRKETIRLLLQASENIGKGEGLYGFIHYVQEAVKGKGSGKLKKADPRNFFLEASSGTMKAVTEISSYLQPFRRDSFLVKDNCPINIKWKDILTDNEHYHVFVSKWIRDEKMKDFIVLALLEGILRNKDILKRPVVVVIPEIRKLCPFKQEGHKIYLGRSIKEALSMMRSSGRGMSSVSDSQVWEDIDIDVRNSPSVTFFGGIGGGSDLDKISKSYNWGRDVRDILKNPENRNSFLPFGIDGLTINNPFTLFFSSSMHGEESYNFIEMYKKHYKTKKYVDVIESMRKMIKEEEDKFRDKVKKKEKAERERLEKEERAKEETRDVKTDKKIERAEKIQEESKIQLMKRCYEIRNDESLDPSEKTWRKISEKLGIHHNTVKKYVEDYSIGKFKADVETKHRDMSTEEKTEYANAKQEAEDREMGKS